MSMGQVNLKQISDTIFLHRFVGTPFNEGNMVCIAFNWGLIFIDAGARLPEAREFRKKMQEKYKSPAKFLLLTHTDEDHILGMAAFKDIPIITSEEGIRKLRQNQKDGVFERKYRVKKMEESLSNIEQNFQEIAEEWRKDYVPKYIEAELFVPQISFVDQLVFSDANQELVVQWCGGHTKCSVFMSYSSKKFAPRKILFTGDNVNANYADNGGCSLARSLDSLELLEMFSQMEVDLYIPGHGPPVDKKYLHQAISYFKKMKSCLSDLKLKQISLETAIQNELLPKFYEEKEPISMKSVLEYWYSVC